MLVQSGDARCTKGDTWCCENKKITVTFVILDGQALKRNHDSKIKKEVNFSNIVDVLGDTFIVGGVCSLSN